MRYNVTLIRMNKIKKTTANADYAVEQMKL